jgi:hypothetical protein
MHDALSSSPSTAKEEEEEKKLSLVDRPCLWPRFMLGKKMVNPMWGI